MPLGEVLLGQIPVSVVSPFPGVLERAVLSFKVFSAEYYTKLCTRTFSLRKVVNLYILEIIAALSCTSEARCR